MHANQQAECSSSGTFCTESTCFTRALHAADHSALHGFRRHPVLHLCVPKGAELTSLGGVCRVRTPCGHGAQVIVEGREEQSDGGERNKDN